MTTPGFTRGRDRLAHAVLRTVATLCLCLIAVSASAQPGVGARQSPPPLSAGRSAKDVAIITVHGEIDPWTAFSIKRRIERAERDGADALVFEIDSPGGDVWSVLEICTAIKSAQVANTVAWIHPVAYSGGAIVALACKEIVCTDYSSFGDALPIFVSPVTGLVDMADPEREKIMGPLLAEVVDSARRNGHDEMLVQRFVRRGVELWLIENTTTGARYFATEAETTAAIGAVPERTNPTVPSVTGPAGGAGAKKRGDGVNPDQAAAPPAAEPAGPLDFLPADPRTPEATQNEVRNKLELLGQATTRPDFRKPENAGHYKVVEYVGDGHGVMMVKTPEMLRYGLAVETVASEADMTAFFGAQNMVRLDETWSEDLARFLTNIWVRGLLVAVFLVCLFVELTHPGVTAPGLLAAVALLALIVPPLLVNMAAWWEVAAILVGIVLIGMELFVIPGFGVCGVLGVVLLFGGLIGTFVGTGSLFPGSTQGRGELGTGVLTVLISTIASGGVMYLLAKHLPSTPLLGRLVLKETLDDGASATMLEAMAGDLGSVRVGAVGRAMTPLRPAGRVLLDNQVVDAVAEYGFVEAGSVVRVVSADGFRTAVEMVRGDGPGAGGVPGSV